MINSCLFNLSTVKYKDFLISNNKHYTLRLEYSDRGRPLYIKITMQKVNSYKIHGVSNKTCAHRIVTNDMFLVS
jgi:hypothetical protein